MMRRFGCRCIFCPPPPRKLRKCQLRKRYSAHRRERAWYERRWTRRYREWERVHIVDGFGVARSATLQRFTGQHGWVDVRELEIRIASGNSTTPMPSFMNEVSYESHSASRIAQFDALATPQTLVASALVQWCRDTLQYIRKARRDDCISLSREERHQVMNTLEISNEEAFTLLKTVSFRLRHLSFEDREEMRTLKNIELHLKEQLPSHYAYSFLLWEQQERS